MDLKGRRAHRKNKPFTTEERRELVARLYVEGKTQVVIAAEVGVSQKTVSCDLTWVHERWKASMTMGLHEHKMRELARLDNVERVAMEQFYRSCENAVTKEVTSEKALRKKQPVNGKAGKHKGGDVGEDVAVLELVPVKEYHKRVVKGQVGDPAFLEVVRKCVMDRAKLLGMLAEDAKTQVNVGVMAGGQGNVGPVSWDSLIGKLAPAPAAPQGIISAPPDPVQQRLDEVRSLTEGTPP